MGVGARWNRTAPPVSIFLLDGFCASRLCVHPADVCLACLSNVLQGSLLCAV
jgi:hypothetical protein